MAQEKILQVKDLRISFKTTGGKLQAVRTISFDLYRGETLAIVGESGSGKSVTSRAIMGILAGNSIKEGGKILFEGKDLMKISEEDFQKIRGDKISMIFQDPLSSLNPIMRIGPQLTEAMLLKNKAAREESKQVLEKYYKELETNMTEAGVEGAAEEVSKFKTISARYSKLLHDYTDARDNTEEAQALAENLALRIENKAIDNSFYSDLSEFVSAAGKSKHPFLVHKNAEKLDEMVAKIKEAAAHKKKDAAAYADIVEPLKSSAEFLKTASERPVPDTFALSYHLAFVEDKIPEMRVDEMNTMTRRELEEGFLYGFRQKAEKAIANAIKKSDAERVKAIALLEKDLPIFEKADPVQSEAEAAAKEMKEAVAKCVDSLEVRTDNLTHTFDTSIDYEIDHYFGGFKRNEKEKKRYERMQRKYDGIVARGKTPEWEVIPASYVDLDEAHQDMIDTVREMDAHLKDIIASNQSPDLAGRTDELIKHLVRQTSDGSYELTKAAAKERAIKLMESVGIDDPRRRFRQYPFEFSGGMRQRIVIAIALTANPEILICDEPTTALDVTIQAQILELINNLKKQRNLSVIFISHDLGVIANMADRIAVMYAGKIVEYGTAEEVFYEPAHPYTWALLSSVPDLATKEKLSFIPGTPPNMIYPPKGDAFAERNANALKIDFEEQPPMFQITETHFAATWLLHPNAPKLEMPAVITERIRRVREQREALK